MVISYPDEISSGTKSHKSSGWLRLPSYVSTRHTALTLNHPDEIPLRAKASGWFTEDFDMSSAWLRVASYVIRMRYHLALSDPDGFLHCQWFKWLTHMVLKLPRILAFRITGPLWGDPPVNLFFAVCRYTEQIIEQTIKLPMISDAMLL